MFCYHDTELPHPNSTVSHTRCRYQGRVDRLKGIHYTTSFQCFFEWLTNYQLGKKFDGLTRLRKTFGELLPIEKHDDATIKFIYFLFHSFLENHLSFLLKGIYRCYCLVYTQEVRSYFYNHQTVFISRNGNGSNVFVKPTEIIMLVKVLTYLSEVKLIRFIKIKFYQEKCTEEYNLKNSNVDDLIIITTVQATKNKKKLKCLQNYLFIKIILFYFYNIYKPKMYNRMLCKIYLIFTITSSLNFPLYLEHTTLICYLYSILNDKNIMVRNSKLFLNGNVLNLETNSLFIIYHMVTVGKFLFRLCLSTRWKV
ncbi:hypothetical protein QTP88_025804 [Uroleucon formosanum]